MIFDDIYLRNKDKILDSPREAYKIIREQIFNKYNISVSFYNITEKILIYPSSILKEYLEKVEQSEVKVVEKKLSEKFSLQETEVKFWVPSVVLDIIDYKRYDKNNYLYEDSINNFYKGEPFGLNLSPATYNRAASTGSVKYLKNNIISVKIYPPYVPLFGANYIENYVAKELFFNKKNFSDMCKYEPNIRIRAELDKLINTINNITVLAEQQTEKAIAIWEFKETPFKKIKITEYNFEAYIGENINISFDKIYSLIKIKYSAAVAKKIKKEIFKKIKEAFDSVKPGGLPSFNNIIQIRSYNLNFGRVLVSTSKSSKSLNFDIYYEVKRRLGNKSLEELNKSREVENIQNYIKEGKEILLTKINNIVSQTLKENSAQLDI